ncbi:MAG: TetR/AcrR family transcriptional regulator [Micropruina sp.]|uniref:TetR/AcrR family transcriptional regulator n=1 Tax=Micropruina sp. TaxID=2737536 RepID=UPI0039E22AD1
MGRAEARIESARKVVAAAADLFTRQGYAATTVPQIAAAAGVSVGTVASVGSKDALFLRVWEEASTAASLGMLAQARQASGSVTDRVWSYVGALVESSIAMPDALRDYFVAYLREREHTENQARLTEVVGAIRDLFPTDREPPNASPAMLAAWTIWLAFSSICFGLAAASIPPEEARRLMRAVVEAQCAPFED